MSLEQLLRDRREEILARFVQEVERKDLSPDGLTRSLLINHIPIFLDEIGAELAAGSEGRLSMDAVEVSETARQHGEQRWNLGYDVEALVREYGVLRRAVLHTAKQAGAPLSADEADTLARYLNVGIGAAITEYVRFREEELKSRQADLEFLTEAGELLGSTLDYQSTLGRLTRLLVPRLADFCVVRLDGCAADETPVFAVNPDNIAVIRELLRTSPPMEGPQGHAEVLRTGQAVLVESVTDGLMEAIAHTPEQLALLRRLGAVSWLVVPLKIKTSLFGTISLGMSDSGRHYKPSDRVLVEDLARRAAAAIDNARLFELSREERARAEAATRAKDEFVAMVSHELRTPLNVIIGWVRLLRSGSLPETTREQALVVVERNANAQSQLVADLLDISRAITGSIRLEPAQVDLGNVITLVVEDARFALEAKRLRLTTDIPADGSVMRGDSERLRQIIWNVLLNAIKFTPKGGELSIRLCRVESDLELTVRDTGIGISADFLPHVFDSFRQSDSRTTRTHGGLGIGLSIVKHLVELHAGSIAAYSEGAGKGASFVVRLPISPVISTTIGVGKLPATTPQPRGLVRPEVLAGTTILIVDDERDARDLLRIILEFCGVTVLDAPSAKDALATLERQPVDLIVSDIGMPEEDGYSLIRRIRALANQSKAATPAIALTAFASTEDRTRALLDGFNLHMTKPVEPAELLSALADLAASTGRAPPESNG
jgi:signal transduction histidine kinase/ActR/RegA family two-component response regulator